MLAYSAIGAILHAVSVILLSSPDLAAAAAPQPVGLVWPLVDWRRVPAMYRPEVWDIHAAGVYDRGGGR